MGKTGYQLTDNQLGSFPSDNGGTRGPTNGSGDNDPILSGSYKPGGKKIFNEDFWKQFIIQAFFLILGAIAVLGLMYFKEFKVPLSELQTDYKNTKTTVEELKIKVADNEKSNNNIYDFFLRTYPDAQFR